MKNNIMALAMVILLFCSSKAQKVFYYKERVNNYSPFTTIDSTIQARVAFIQNSTNDSWMIQFMNVGLKSVTFNYTVYGPKEVTTSLTMKPHSATPIMYGATGTGCREGCDYIISLSYPTPQHPPTFPGHHHPPGPHPHKKK